MTVKVTQRKVTSFAGSDRSLGNLSSLGVVTVSGRQARRVTCIVHTSSSDASVSRQEGVSIRLQCVPPRKPFA